MNSAPSVKKAITLDTLIRSVFVGCTPCTNKGKDGAQSAPYYNPYLHS